MKAFCALLLLVAYVSADHHACDPLAADTYKKPDAKPELGDQWISLDDFQKIDKARFFVAKATPTTLANANSYCNAASYGKECGSIEYFREITAGPAANSDVGADKLKFKTVFVGVNKVKDEAVEYHMEMEGKNSDDYIIQATATEIEAVRIQANGDRHNIKEQDIPADIVQSLRKEYGLFHSKPGSFTVYSTCDGLTFWVSYSLEAIAAKKHLQEDAELETVLANLRVRAKEIRKKIHKENEEPTVIGIPTEITNKKFTEKIPKA